MTGLGDREALADISEEKQFAELYITPISVCRIAQACRFRGTQSAGGMGTSFTYIRLAPELPQLHGTRDAIPYTYGNPIYRRGLINCLIEVCRWQMIHLGVVFYCIERRPYALLSFPQ